MYRYGYQQPQPWPAHASCPSSGPYYPNYPGSRPCAPPASSSPFRVEPLPRPPIVVEPRRVYSSSDAETLYEHGLDRSDVQTLWQHDGVVAPIPPTAPTHGQARTGNEVGTGKARTGNEIGTGTGTGHGYGSEGRSRGRDYLSSLSVGMSGLDLATGVTQGQEKPLPPIPDSHCPAYPHHRPTDWRAYFGRAPPPSGQLRYTQPKPGPEGVTAPSPVTHTVLVEPTTLPSPSASLLSPPRHEQVARPVSEPVLKTPRKSTAKPRRGSSHLHAIYVPSSPSASSASSSSPTLPHTVTTRSPARRRRAASEQPSSAQSASASTSASTPTGKSVRCAGFTRQGQPCKRLVRAEAPFLALPQDPDEAASSGERTLGRYCRDHAGMICQAEGFYARAGKDATASAGVWIEFTDFIPPELGQQTQTLLRMVMESKLTDKEAPGFLYAYELRDMQTPDTSYFKVGRTDNPPRRVSEWSTNCPAHKITLRDVFPLRIPPSTSSSSPSISSLSTSSPSASAFSSTGRIPPYRTGTSTVTRKPSAPTSYLPGAHAHNPASAHAKMCPAMKRWERLVHLELAERSATARPREFARAREKCATCDKVHREVFPIARARDAAGAGRGGGGASGSGREYAQLVQVICRWERFVRVVSSGT